MRGVKGHCDRRSAIGTRRVHFDEIIDVWKIQRVRRPLATPKCHISSVTIHILVSVGVLTTNKRTAQRGTKRNNL